MTQESPLKAAQARFINVVPFRSTGSTTKSLIDANGFTLYEDAVAGGDMPPYPRAIVEGFLVNAADTQGANDTHPVSFRVIGKVMPGDRNCPVPGKGEAIEVATGSLVCVGSFAIVRMWEAKRADNQISVARPFPPAFFIEQQGCDIKQGAVAVARGTILGPWELGLLAGLGVDELRVAQSATVAIFSCGDEVIPHTQDLYPGAIRDSNSIMLSAAVTNAGGIPRFAGIMRDDFDGFLARLNSALATNSMALISGGTAAGARDFVSDLIRAAGELVVDGVPMKSGRPLIMGIANGKPIVAVAGHPPEALRGFRLFGAAAIDRIMGRERPLPDDEQPAA